MPQALEVPTARTGETPRQIRIGTVMLPPPMPTSAETAPIRVPIALRPAPRGTATAPAPGFGFGPVQQQLRCGQHAIGDHEQAQALSAQPGGQQAAQPAAQQQARQQPGGGRPQHTAAKMMGAGRCGGGQDDAGQGGRQCRVHRGLGRHALGGQQQGQGGDQHQAAANAEQAREQTGHDAEQPDTAAIQSAWSIPVPCTSP